MSWADWLLTQRTQALNRVAQEREALSKAVDRVRSLHQPEPYSDDPETTYCGHCQSDGSAWSPSGRFYPCPTIQALGQSSGGQFGLP